MLKVHAQLVADPVATDLLLFVCASEEFVASKLFVCNTTAGATTFGIAVVPASDVEPAVTTQHYLYGPTKAIAANTTEVIPAGITMARGDAIFVRAAAGVTFTLFGEGVGAEG